MTLQSILTRAADGETFTPDEIEAALDALMADTANDMQRAAFMMALRVRGETVDEIAGATRLLRRRMTAITVADPDAVDIVGTGGDSHGTYNVSTCAALVAAGAGVTIAKHGNRSVSSKSGASDVLAALGVKIDAPLETVTRAVDTCGVGFMWAPMHHAAMKTWAPARAALGVRTLFNVLGPLCNPAGVRRQVLGVYDRGLVRPMAEVLLQLGAHHAWVVHGHDGMDELTTTGPSTVAELNNGKIIEFSVTPGDAGLKLATLDDLRGGDATVNARAIRDVLDGTRNAFRDIVVLNAAAALVVAGKAANLGEGVPMAETAIDSGAAKSALAKLVTITNQDPEVAHG